MYCRGQHNPILKLRKNSICLCLIITNKFHLPQLNFLLLVIWNTFYMQYLFFLLWFLQGFSLFFTMILTCSSIVKLDGVLHESELARCAGRRAKSLSLMLHLDVFFLESVDINLGLNLAFFNLSPSWVCPEHLPPLARKLWRWQFHGPLALGCDLHFNKYCPKPFFSCNLMLPQTWALFQGHCFFFFLSRKWLTNDF